MGFVGGVVSSGACCEQDRRHPCVLAYTGGKIPSINTKTGNSQVVMAGLRKQNPSNVLERASLVTQW